MTQGKEALITENVEVDIETLADALSYRVNPYTRSNARQRIAEAVLKALTPEDRRKLETYQKENNPCEKTI